MVSDEKIEGLDAGAGILVKISGDGEVILYANNRGLDQLAQWIEVLRGSEAPEHIHCEDYEVLEPGSAGLALVRVREIVR